VVARLDRDLGRHQQCANVLRGLRWRVWQSGWRFTTDYPGKALLRDRGLENVKRVAFIIVNAQTQPGKEWRIANATPGLAALLDSVSSVQVNRYSFETIELLRQTIIDWSKEYTANDRSHLQSNIVEVSFEQLIDENERRSFAGIPTAFDLPDSQIDRLREVGRRILFDSPDFRLLRHDVGGTTEMQVHQ